MEGRAWWKPQLSSYITLAGKVLGIHIPEMAEVTSCVCERLKAGEADFVEKDRHQAWFPVGNPGWPHAQRALSTTCGSGSSCPLGASTSRRREGRKDVPVLISWKITSFSRPPPNPHFLLRGKGFIGGGSMWLNQTEFLKKEMNFERGKERG